MERQSRRETKAADGPSFRQPPQRGKEEEAEVPVDDAGAEQPDPGYRLAAIAELGGGLRGRDEGEQGGESEQEDSEVEIAPRQRQGQLHVTSSESQA
jgi:hypothetical protein